MIIGIKHVFNLENIIHRLERLCSTTVLQHNPVLSNIWPIEPFLLYFDYCCAALRIKGVIKGEITTKSSGGWILSCGEWALRSLRVPGGRYLQWEVTANRSHIHPASPAFLSPSLSMWGSLSSYRPRRACVRMLNHYQLFGDLRWYQHGWLPELV